jgi:hypothetical protein
MFEDVLAREVKRHNRLQMGRNCLSMRITGIQSVKVNLFSAVNIKPEDSIIN